MEQSRSAASGGGDDNVGIPDDLRCKRSDGKQWRCTAMSMPDKTVCEKHYIQAKKRAANSALRASLKKAKRKSLGDSEIYSESKSDDMDVPLSSSKAGDPPLAALGKKHKEKAPKNQLSPETPSMKGLPIHSASKSYDGLQRDMGQFEDSRRSYKTSPPAKESSKNKLQNIFDSSAMTATPEESSDSFDDTETRTCHQCRQNVRDRVLWCLRCDRRGYCENCISTWYPAILFEDIQRVCPACRGICNCKLCLRGDNLIKARIRDIPVRDKLQYLYCLLSSVLPVVKRIHHEQCFEVELEKRLRGNIELSRTKLNADEQMCCDFCRAPIIDYHRHCMNCSYDLCLSCCQDLREAYMVNVKGEHQYQTNGRVVESFDKQAVSELARPSRPNLLDNFPEWEADRDGSIPCPPKVYGGCGCSPLVLKRIFKMNWVAKLVKNVDEMVSGCKLRDNESLQENELNPRFYQAANRQSGDDNLLYCPSSQDIRNGGIGDFRKQWMRGKPVIVKDVFDMSSMPSWDPIVIWNGIRETAGEKMKVDNRIVKAVDCLGGSEIEIELIHFIKGYSEGRIHDNGWPEMLKLKDWPSPSAAEEFLYQRPDFVSKLPLLEFIHTKWGLLNVAAKLPHYSLQNDVGPKIFFSYGLNEELGQGDSVENLHFNMRDMVYLLVHTCEPRLEGWQGTKIVKAQKAHEESEPREIQGDPKCSSNGSASPNVSLGDADGHRDSEANLVFNKDEKMDDGRTESTSSDDEKTFFCKHLNEDNGTIYEETRPGALWDVFHREDVPKLIEYLKVHWTEFGKHENLLTDSVPHPLHDGLISLDRHHIEMLKEQFGVEPWSFEQHLGQAIFIPAGCPFQVRNLQSTVQLGLDFLSPESLGEAVRLADEIRGLPNDHDAKLQMLEVGKISLYAASSAIKEVHKLVLDPKLGAELGVEDPNLTALVTENLEMMMRGRQITCV